MCTEMTAWQLAGCTSFRWFDFFFKSDHSTQGCNGDSSPAGPLPTGRAQRLFCRGSGVGKHKGTARPMTRSWPGRPERTVTSAPSPCHLTPVSSFQQPYNLDAVSVPISQMRMLKLINLTTSPKTGAEWAVEKTHDSGLASHASLSSAVLWFPAAHTSQRPSPPLAPLLWLLLHSLEPKSNTFHSYLWCPRAKLPSPSCLFPLHLIGSWSLSGTQVR